MIKKICFLLALVLILFISACKTSPPAIPARNIADAKPAHEPLSKYGNPECYEVDGQRYYVLKSAEGYCQTGLASWYGTKFHGKHTSSREPYDMFAMTAASRNLPLPTYVEVTNLENGKRIIVKVNDRGPFKSDRIIDLSYAAAMKLGFADRGTANVQVKAIDMQEVQDKQLTHEVILANAGETSGIQIHEIALPSPNQSKSLTLARYLQLGAFSNRDNAVRLQQDIAPLVTAKVIIREVTSNHKTIYRVQIGPFDSSEASEEIKGKLASAGHRDAITVFSD